VIGELLSWSAEEECHGQSIGAAGIECDAPPYSVVRACRKLGFLAPLDVRWFRMSHFLAGDSGLFGSFSWLGFAGGWFFGGRRPNEHTCTCGESLPFLERYAFTVAEDRGGDYRLGQCPRCRTMFWEEG
jgi:hypothetical protein